MALNIYLAGPDVFIPNAIEIGDKKIALCKERGFKGLFPLDRDQDLSDDAARIFLANRSLMERAEIGMFNLTPFRGSSADAGTVFELGFMCAAGKHVYGYTCSTSAYIDRIEGPMLDEHGQRWDRFGYKVEDFGLTDNLMIERAIREAGGTIVRAEEDSGNPLAALHAFELCLAKVARDHPAEPPAEHGASAHT